RNLFFICVGLAALHTLTFFRGSKSIFKEVNAYVQRKQRHRPKKKSVFYLCGIGGITYSHFFPWE
ncbi:hypothetical protein ACR74R_16075, partial [Mediterraneibacter gnavus]